MATRRSERRVTRSTSTSTRPTTETQTENLTDMKTELQQTEIRFRKACNQINLLNRKMESIHKRYNCAKKNNHRVFRYKLRLRLAVVEGLRNMYYEYANKKEPLIHLDFEVIQYEVIKTILHWLLVHTIDPNLKRLYWKPASRVVELRRELFNENVEVVEQEDSDYEDSEMDEAD